MPSETGHSQKWVNIIQPHNLSNLIIGKDYALYLQLQIFFQLIQEQGCRFRYGTIFIDKSSFLPMKKETYWVKILYKERKMPCIIKWTKSRLLNKKSLKQHKEIRENIIPNQEKYLPFFLFFFRSVKKGKDGR